MSKLEQLLEGVDVEWKTLGEVTEIKRGKRLVKSQLEETGKYAVYQNSMVPLGYYSESNVKADTTYIICAGAAGEIGYSDVDFWAADDVSYFATTSNFESKFLYYFLLTQQTKLSSQVRRASVPRLSKTAFEKLLIPIPPLSVQAEIVRILDTFTELEVELAAELQKRRVQYKYYSTLLFDNVIESNFHSIIEFCNIVKGVTPIQKAIPGKYPMVVTTTERKSCETYQFNAKAVCIPLVSSRGHGVASLNHVYYQEGKFALGNILCAIIPKNEEQVYSKYLYYYFEQTKEYTLVPLMKGGANVALRMTDIEKVKVPIPSLEEQYRIVSILDKFDTLTTSISEGLPKEIELRKKQYEYYRDMLLDFGG